MRRNSTFIATVTGLVALGAMLLPAGAGAVITTGFSGTVIEAETPHNAITNVNVCVYTESGANIACHTVVTNGSGEYTVPVENAGTYLVGFSAAGFTGQYFNEASSFEEATPVTVTANKVTPEVNAKLEKSTPGTLAGRVTNASNGQGAAGVEVCAAVLTQRCTETNGNGEYSLTGLTPGVNHVELRPAETCEEEQGEKIRCQPKSNYLDQATTAKVKSGKTETLNVTLQPGGQISGIVTNASITHPGLGKVEVCAFKSGKTYEEYAGCAFTNASGQYTISGLTSGSYKVEFNGYVCTFPKPKEGECPEVYVTTYYHAQQTLKKGQAVSVSAGSNTTGIDESLREAFPTAPVATAAPALTGTPVAGQVLSCSQGSWSHEPTYLIYQWQRNGTIIPGQAGGTYTAQAADVGHSITCSVTAGNGAGAATATSNALAIPVPIAVLAKVAVKGRVVLVTLSCPALGPCSGTMKLVARILTRHGRRGPLKARNVTIGHAAFAIAPGKSVTLRVGLTRTGRTALIRARRRGLKVRILGSGVAARLVTLHRHR